MSRSNVEAPRPRRVIARRLALATCTLAVMVVAAEVAATFALGDAYERGRIPRLSWFHGGVREPFRGWSPRPGLVAELSDGPARYDVEINAAGYRDDSRTHAKASGVRRVLLLGDSVTFGWGVRRDERFGDLLADRLGDGVEVVNLACPGYGTDQELWTLERDGLAFAPDVVVLTMIMNDLRDADNASYRGLGKPRFVRSGETWVREEADPALVVERGLPWLVRASRWSAAAAWLRARREPPPQAELPTARMRYNAAMARKIGAQLEAMAGRLADDDELLPWLVRRIRDRCEERGARLVLATVPHRHDQALYDPRFEAPPEGLEVSAWSRQVAALGARLGVPVAVLDGAFIEHVTLGEFLHMGDGHPNGLGHELIADALEPLVREALAAE